MSINNSFHFPAYTALIEYIHLQRSFHKHGYYSWCSVVGQTPIPKGVCNHMGTDYALLEKHVCGLELQNVILLLVVIHLYMIGFLSVDK